MDTALLAQIDAVARLAKEKRSAIMRRALRLGLPLVRTQETIIPPLDTAAARLASMPQLKAAKRNGRKA